MQTECAKRPPHKSAISRHNSIRVGLSHVKGLTSRSLHSLVENRSRAPYSSLYDFLERSGVRPSEAETLAMCGALDSFSTASRPLTMWRIKLFYMGETERLSIPYLADHTAVEKSISEREILGLSVSAHPLRIYGGDLCSDIIRAVDLGGAVGKVVKLAGWLVTSKRTRTKHGEFMKFLTMEDETAIFEVTLFPKVYLKFGHVLQRDYGPYLVTGKVEDDGGDVTVTGRRIERLLQVC